MTKKDNSTGGNSNSFAEGWTLTYNAFLTNIQTYEKSVSDIYIYPNPATKNTIIEFDIMRNSYINFTITNILGQVLYNYNKDATAGHFQFNLLTTLPDINAGVYFINLKTDNNLITKKMIIE